MDTSRYTMDSSRYSIASGLTMGRRRHNANQFNIMVTGHSLSGKSSFIRTFQHTLNIKNKTKKQQPEKRKIENQFNDLKIIDNENSSIAISVSPELNEEQNLNNEIEFYDFPPKNIYKPIASDTFEIIEDGERINLRLIDTPGLPIPVHNISKNASDFDPKIIGEWCTSILLYIENQYEITLLEESRVRRNRRFPDSQVHVCLYLIDATTASVANGLTAIDIITIQKLAERVNLVPCLSKADLMTVKQLERIKRAIRNDIDEHNLPIYMFDDDDDDDQEIKDQNAMFRNMIPFVLVNAEETEVGDRTGIEYIHENGKNILGRQYTWGTVDVENPEHCDFCDVKTFLLETHINDLKQLTKDYYYESWRTNKLMEVKGAISKPVVSSGLRQSAMPMQMPMSMPPNGAISPPPSNQPSPMVAPQQPVPQPMPQPQQPVQVQPLTPQQVALMAANNSYQPQNMDEEINIPEKVSKPHRRTKSKAESIKSINSTKQE